MSVDCPHKTRCSLLSAFNSSRPRKMATVLQKIFSYVLSWMKMYEFWWRVDNIPALVQIMAWCGTGDKPLFTPMVTLVIDAYMRRSASVSSLISCGSNINSILLKFIIPSGSLSSHYEIAPRWISQDLVDHWTTLVQVMSWHRQATNHYLS